MDASSSADIDLDDFLSSEASVGEEQPLQYAGQTSGGQPKRYVLGETEDVDITDLLRRSREVIEPGQLGGISDASKSSYLIYGDKHKFRVSFEATEQGIIDRHYPEYIRLLQCTDVLLLRDFVRKKYSKIVWGEFLEQKLRELVMTFATSPFYQTTLRERDSNPHVCIQILRDILERAERRLDIVDVSFDPKGEGANLDLLIEKTGKKMSSVIEDLQDKIKQQEDEIQLLKDNVKLADSLAAELQASKNYIRNLKLWRAEVQDPPTDEAQFRADLQYQLDWQQQVNSSLVERLEQEERTKEALTEQFLNLEQKRAMDHEERLKELGSLTKDLQLEQGIRREIVEKIQSLTANPKEVEKAVNDWMQATRNAIQTRHQRLYDMKRLMKQYDRDIAKEEVELGTTQKLIKTVQTGIDEKRLRLVEMQKIANDLDARILVLQTRTTNLELKLMQMEDPFINTTSRIIPELGFELDSISEGSPRSVVSEGSPRDVSPRQYAMFTEDMKESFTMEPDRKPRAFSPHLQMAGPSGVEILSPHEVLGPQLLEEQMASDELPLQTSSGITNRIDIGESFNMQTSQTGELAPYNQVTRLVSKSPQAGTSRMADSPINIQHTADITPPGFKTPFISKTRFGYTDPDERRWNFPPRGKHFQCDTKFQRTLLLDSPKGNDYVVSIDVDPKPIVETETGEHFVCDISLDLQPGGQGHQLRQQRRQRPPRIKTVETRGIPPAETPTSTRRRGLFTPTGIFKKKHYNVRKVPGKHPIADLPWSPSFLRDAGSPVGPFPPSPLKLSDRSISWEYEDSDQDAYEGLDLSDDTPPAVIQGSQFPKSGPSMSSAPKSSPSPLIGRQSHRGQTSVSTPDSPSPIIKSQFYTARSPDTSPSPMIKSQFYRARSPDTSPSPMIKSQFYRARSPGTSPSPMIKTQFYRGLRGRRPHESGPTSPYRRESPASDRSFAGSPTSPFVSQRSPMSGYEPDSDRSFAGSPTLPFVSQRTPTSRYEPDSDRSFAGSPTPALAQSRSYGSDSMDSEHGYLEDPLGSSMLDEEEFQG